MEKYNKLDLVSIEILKLLSDYSLKDVQEILKKTEYNIARSFHCIFDEASFKSLTEKIENEIN